MRGAEIRASATGSAWERRFKIRSKSSGESSPSSAHLSAVQVGWLDWSEGMVPLEEGALKRAVDMV